MNYRINLNSTNCQSLCLLPNGVQVIIVLQFRFFNKKWVIKLKNTDGEDLTDYVPLQWNSNLFGQYTYLTPIYGRFFVLEANRNVDITDAVNDTIVLFWSDE